MGLPVAIIGSGNIGTDLMFKIERSPTLDLVALIGIDPESDGLARARDRGHLAASNGIDWVREHPEAVRMVFDATSAYVHVRHAKVLAELGIRAIDLTPAARGPKVIPSVNLMDHLDAPNVNMVTCGGQATTPMVAAVSRVTRVPYAEMVSTVASLSAGPGTRQNIDEFTKTTAKALEEIGGAEIGKAIIILNPAEPPILMRNTVFCALPDGTDHEAVLDSVRAMAADVAKYVPGYRLKQPPVIEAGPFHTPGGVVPHRIVVLLEVEGAGDYLPPFAGNLDIMTAAAVRVGEAIAAHQEVPA
ncbi:MAG: acetaldehyde dehydrogenase (acetylating) [Actinomycetales bacterium]|nr:acetaldehyde dehydrogenase (acetylating) [Actinomycetales bacterium]